MTATISTIDMYNLLREKIGDQQAKALTDYVTQQVETTFEKQKNLLATKADIADLKASTKEDVADLKVRIAEAKSDTIKWVFTFFVTIALMIVGLYIRR